MSSSSSAQLAPRPRSRRRDCQYAFTASPEGDPDDARQGPEDRGRHRAVDLAARCPSPREANEGGLADAGRRVAGDPA